MGELLFVLNGGRGRGRRRFLVDMNIFADPTVVIPCYIYPNKEIQNYYKKRVFRDAAQHVQCENRLLAQSSWTVLHMPQSQ